MTDLEKFTPQEIVDGFVPPVELNSAEREEADLRLAEVRRRRAIHLSDSQVRYAQLLQLRFDLEGYLAQPKFDSEKTFSYFLKRYVAIYPSSKQDLAEELGIHKSLLSQWLAGTRNPSSAQLIRLEIHAQAQIPAVAWLKLLARQDEHALKTNDVMRKQERKNVKSQLEISPY